MCLYDISFLFFIYLFLILSRGLVTFSRCNKDDLLNEIKMLKQAGRHPNIVSFIGACTQEGICPFFQPRSGKKTLSHDIRYTIYFLLDSFHSTECSTTCTCCTGLYVFPFIIIANT